jgi:glycogen(starch) synthase
MRILHILDHSPPHRSAYTRRTMGILNQQRSFGWHPICLTGPNQGAAPTPDRNAGSWHFFRTGAVGRVCARHTLLRQLAGMAMLARRLQKVIQLTRPDVLHVHPPAINAFAALHAARRCALPVVLEVHPLWSDTGDAWRSRLGRALDLRVARRVDAIVTSSRGLASSLSAQGVDAGRIVVVPPAASARAPGPPDASLARALGLGRGPVIAFGAGSHRHEGLELMLAALPSLLCKYPALRLLVLAAGELDAALRGQVARLGLSGKVIFSGSVSAPQVPRCLALANLVVYPRLPSPQADLVAPVRPLEAMAQGSVVIASNVGGHRELIAHGRTGILFEAGSASALAEAALSLLAEPSCWPAIGAAARAFVAAERSWPATAARYGPLYSSLMNPHPA